MGEVAYEALPLPDSIFVVHHSFQMSEAQTLSRTDQAARQLQLLGELAEIGLDIARAIERQIKPVEREPSLAELNAAATAYARVARAVRQTILLQSRLLTESRADSAQAGVLRTRASGIVRQAIEGEYDDREKVERLAREAAEGLEREVYGDILIRPIGESVRDICRDLGLEPDWPALADTISAAEAFARGDRDTVAAPYTGPMEVRWLDDDEEPVAAADSS
jgi:hypothetical protein